jgi:hypothetical protein
MRQQATAQVGSNLGVTRRFPFLTLIRHVIPTPQNPFGQTNRRKNRNGQHCVECTQRLLITLPMCKYWSPPSISIRRFFFVAISVDYQVHELQATTWLQSDSPDPSGLQPSHHNNAAPSSNIIHGLITLACNTAGLRVMSNASTTPYDNIKF